MLFPAPALLAARGCAFHVPQSLVYSPVSVHVLVIQHSYLSECLSLQVTPTFLYLPLSSITLPSLSAGTVVMFFLFPNPWPNSIASQRKFRNVEFRTQTCSGLPNRLTSICKFSRIAKCSLTCAPILRKTTVRPTFVGWQNDEKLAFTCLQI